MHTVGKQCHVSACCIYWCSILSIIGREMQHIAACCYEFWKPNLEMSFLKKIVLTSRIIFGNIAIIIFRYIGPKYNIISNYVLILSETVSKSNASTFFSIQISLQRKIFFLLPLIIYIFLKTCVAQFFFFEWSKTKANIFFMLENL